MNRDEIAQMMQDSAGANWGTEAHFQRFAALVAAESAKCGECGKSAAKGWALYCVQCYEGSMVKAAVAAEREACALVCEKEYGDSIDDAERYTSRSCATAIRARGEEPKRHPGYIVGDHWLQAAYTRVCTGEDIRQVMEDYGYYP